MYTPLYVKSNYSFLSSLVKIDELISKCKKDNISSVALTDKTVDALTVEANIKNVVIIVNNKIFFLFITYTSLIKSILYKMFYMFRIY